MLLHASSAGDAAESSPASFSDTHYGLPCAGSARTCRPRTFSASRATWASAPLASVPWTSSTRSSPSMFGGCPAPSMAPLTRCSPSSVAMSTACESSDRSGNVRTACCCPPAAAAAAGHLIGDSLREQGAARGGAGEAGADQDAAGTEGSGAGARAPAGHRAGEHNTRAAQLEQQQQAAEKVAAGVEGRAPRSSLRTRDEV
jgi:hypothetical protein